MEAFRAGLRHWLAASDTAARLVSPAAAEHPSRIGFLEYPAAPVAGTILRWRKRPMLWHLDTTICAIASGTSPAPRGIIRVSGPEAVALCESLCRAPEDLRQVAFSAVRYATRVPTSVRISRFASPVQVAMHVWPDHRSYTGQPSVELHTIGSPIILQLLLEKLIAAGCTAAAPGEFTYRAFLNGRIDLTQAEAVLGVIHAKNQSHLDVSLRQLAGGLAAPLQSIRSTLINLLADLEAGLDFVEEDIEFVERHVVERTLDAVRAGLTSLRKQLGSRRLVHHLPRAVLAGLANAGKSSLINAVCPSAKAIVSDAAGTTRDFLRCEMPLGGATAEMIDTAGFEPTDASPPADDARSSHVQQEAQRRRQLLWDQADLLLCCGDAVQMASADWTSLLRNLPREAGEENGLTASASRPIWLVRTKADLTADEHPVVQTQSGFERTFSTSVLSGAGIEELICALADWAAESSVTDSDVVPMTLVRCAASIEAADEAICAALAVCRGESEVDRSAEAARGGWGGELIAAELRLALHELGVVAGAVYTDDILDALFSRFCIGK